MWVCGCDWQTESEASLSLQGNSLIFRLWSVHFFLKVEGCLCLCCFSTEPEGSVAALYSQKYVDMHRFKGDFFPYEKHYPGCSCRFRCSFCQFRLSVLVKSTKNRCKVQKAKISTECSLNFCQVVQERCYDLESPSFVPVILRLPCCPQPSAYTQLPLFLSSLCLSHNYHSALSFFLFCVVCTPSSYTHTLQTVKWDRNSQPSIH